MKTYKLIQMSFDGEYVQDSEHETIEQAEQTSSDLGSKWYFYPLTVIVKGQTVKETGGSLCFISSGEPVLSELLKGKRLKTVKHILNTVSKLDEAQYCEWDQFEILLIDYLQK